MRLMYEGGGACHTAGDDRRQPTQARGYCLTVGGRMAYPALAGFDEITASYVC